MSRTPGPPGDELPHDEALARPSTGAAEGRRAVQTPPALSVFSGVPDRADAKRAPKHAPAPAPAARPA
jgi:hypothetical protein